MKIKDFQTSTQMQGGCRKVDDVKGVVETASSETSASESGDGTDVEDKPDLEQELPHLIYDDEDIER